MSHTVIEFSGGLDSSYVLWHYLNNTSDDVTAIYFDYTLLTENQQNKLAPQVQLPMRRMEKEAAQKVVDWCKSNIRDFTYLIKNGGRNLENGDVTHEHRTRECAKYAQSVGAQNVVSGRAANRPDMNNWGKNPMTRTESTETLKAYADSANTSIGGNSAITFSTPLGIYDLNKNIVHRIQELPEDLFALVHKCTHPVFDANYQLRECNNCTKELWRTMAIDAVTRGLTTANNFATWFTADLNSNSVITFDASALPLHSGNVTIRKFDFINNLVNRGIVVTSNTDFVLSTGEYISTDTNVVDSWNLRGDDRHLVTPILGNLQPYFIS